VHPGERKEKEIPCYKERGDENADSQAFSSKIGLNRSVLPDSWRGSILTFNQRVAGSNPAALTTLKHKKNLANKLGLSGLLFSC
jgi:hypothetical protein